ncbi:MAG: HAD family phosphatase [Thaumarchaeota archaeon]|nr:HAD family phosphatase [Nitrososphaerota archaeon]
MKKIIFFDLGGVLLNWQDDWLYEEISKQTKISKHKIIQDFESHISLLFTGKISEIEFWQKTVGNLIINHNIISETFQKYASLNENILGLANYLKKCNHEIGILSNITPETRKVLPDIWFTNFDHVYFSNEIGLAKPDPKIFDYLLEKHQHSEIFLIDDKKENTDVAKMHGINAILYDGQGDLISQIIQENH